jgi:feruloyl-CoA synthase
MSHPAPIRRISLGRGRVIMERDAQGTQRMKNSLALGKYPVKLTERLVEYAHQAPDRTLFAKRDGTGSWRTLSYAQALDAARRIGQALLDRGLDAERPLLILSENDLEHAMLALAALHVGVPFAPVSPAYSLISQDFGKLRYIVELMTPGLVFVADGQRYERALRAALPASTELVVTDAPPQDRAATPFAALVATDATARVDAAYSAVNPDTLAKFLFTSGSTGMPKAVIHTQRMLCSNLQQIIDCLPFMAEEPPVLVDWLPWNHTFGGSHNFGLTLYNGGTLYIDDGKPVPQLIGKTIENLREIAPTVYFNVPRGFEEIFAALDADRALARHFFSRVKMLFYAAAGLSQPMWDRLHRVAEETCGERILMITGLGMTETAPFALCANWEDGRSGLVGIPAPGLELKLAPVEDKLEARYRGPNITPGFWRQAELTRAGFDEEGFYRSGDAVRFADPADPDQGLMFDGRITEDFKLDSGTWVSVGPLRAKIMAAGAPYVQDVVITGLNQRDVGIMVFPHVDSCRRFSKALPPTAGPGEIVADSTVRAWFQSLLDTLGDGSEGSASRVARGMLLEVPPSIDLGEMTDKGSINQRAVLAHRAALVDELHADVPSARVFLAATAVTHAKR